MFKLELEEIRDYIVKRIKMEKDPAELKIILECLQMVNTMLVQEAYKTNLHLDEHFIGIATGKAENITEADPHA